MTRLARRIGLGGALALAAACGGQAFTTIAGDGGAGDAATDAPGDGSSTVPSDGPRDVAAETASDAGSRDATTVSDGPSSDADGAADATPIDAFVPDVVEEPPAHCGGAFECVPAVPSGWSGPFEVYAAAAASPSCSTNFAGPAYNGNNDLIAKAAQCECTCGTATVACSTPAISFYSEVLLSSNTCSSSNHCEDVPMTPGACKYINASTACASILGMGFDMIAGGSVVSDAGCPAVPSEALGPTTWGVNARACVSSLAPAQVDCPAGSVCAPTPASPFGSGLCISHTGDVPCPTSGYTVSQVFYGSVDDQRSCSSCTCGGVTGASCAATVAVSTSTNGTCSTGTIQYSAPTSCDPVQQPGDYRVTVTPSAGSCTASTVTPTGAATPAGPTTFCCLP